MCNKNLFRYAEDKLDGTCPIFGAMIKPANTDMIDDIIQKLGYAKFACKVTSNMDETEDAQEDEIKLIMLLMN